MEETGEGVQPKFNVQSYIDLILYVGEKFGINYDIGMGMKSEKGRISMTSFMDPVMARYWDL